MRPASGSTLVPLVAALSLAVPVSSSAQLTLGVGGGLVSSTVTGSENDVVVIESKTGMNVGAWLAIPIGGRLAFVPGAHFVQKGATGTDPGYSATTLEISYVEIPLLLSVALSPVGSSVGFSLFGGPSVAFEAGCTVTFTLSGTSLSDDCDPADEDERQTLDFGAVIGGGVQVPMAPTVALMLSAGADFSLRRLDAGPDPSGEKFRALFASLGLAFTIGG